MPGAHLIDLDSDEAEDVDVKAAAPPGEQSASQELAAALSGSAAAATPERRRFDFRHFEATPLKAEPPAKRACLASSWQRLAPEREATTSSKPLALLLVSLQERLLAQAPAFDSQAGRNRPGQVPVLDLYGVTKEGHSVLLHVHGFRPYFYASRPTSAANAGSAASLEAWRSALERAALGRSGGGGGVELLEEVEKTPLMHYQEKPEQLLRVVLSSPKLLGPCRSVLETGVMLPGGLLWNSPVFEGNVPLPLRFLVDVGASGGGWLEVPGGRYRVRPDGGQRRSSSAQLEVDAHWSALQGHAAEGDWMALAPLRLLSLHLRTAGADGRVVAAGALLQVHGASAASESHSVAWAVSPTGGQTADVHTDGGGSGGSYAAPCLLSSEAELLEQLRLFVVQADPDIILGYDLLNGHLTSAISRVSSSGGRGSAKQGSGYCLGRLSGVASRVRNATFETRQLGKHETKDINVDGRLLFDLLTLFEREQKLSSYSLSALALNVLGESRLELRASDVERLSADDPACLASMALRDASLAMQLFQAQHFLFRYVEMARVTGVPMEYLLSRGQSVKVLSMLLRKAKAHGYILPPQQRGAPAGLEEGEGAGTGSYEGGAVLEPLSGFYEEPVVTLDFASLYPSIMQKHNLCYSTLLRPGAAPEHEEVPELGHRFVTTRVRKGLIPMVLEELLQARARAKRELKQAESPALRAVLDGRQLALKISANSVYGFTGMSVGMLPCQAIAASVTAYGRQMIERTKALVEGKICRGEGKDWNARVIYGDTDSVMLTLGAECPMQHAFELGKEASELVSDAFGAPVKMEFEKVYRPFLLMSKKRYAGLAWPSASSEVGKLDFKGIEVVRRDWCLLVRQVVERSLELLLRERSQERAIEYVRDTVAELRSGRVDLRSLVISKALVRDGAEAYAARQAHVELAERLKQRDPSKAPKVGERVPYVFVAKGAGATACDRAEDPLHALEAGVPLDAEYYVEHQLKLPLLRVFEPVLGSSRASVEQLLFGASTGNTPGKPLLPRRASASGRGGGTLAAFVRARARCMAPGCRALLEDEVPRALCPRCDADPGRMQEAILAQLSTLRPLEAESARLLATCLRCEGSLCKGLHVACTNTDCPIFFRRRQASQELQATRDAMKKISLDW